MVFSNDQTQTDWNLIWTVENQVQKALGCSESYCSGLPGEPEADHVVEFVYDADGMMVMRTEDGDSTVYLGKLYQHDLASDNKTRNYVFNGMLVAQRINNVGNGDVKFFLTNHLGSTTTTIRANGTLESQLPYDPWGEERYSYGITPTGYRYTGQRQDDTLGLYDYKARYYDPTIGRFVSADTIVPITDNTALTVDFYEFAAKNNDGNGPFLPQFLNRYTYVLNNPVTHVDSTGHSPDGEISVIIAPGDLIDEDGNVIPGSLLDTLNNYLDTLNTLIWVFTLGPIVVGFLIYIIKALAENPNIQIASTAAFVALTELVSGTAAGAILGALTLLATNPGGLVVIAALVAVAALAWLALNQYKDKIEEIRDTLEDTARDAFEKGQWVMIELKDGGLFTDELTISRVEAGTTNKIGGSPVHINVNFIASSWLANKLYEGFGCSPGNCNTIFR